MNTFHRHTDPGLQPERTSLSWGRTMLAMVVVSMLFLRWIPDYGWFPVVLMGLSLLIAGSVALTQRRRYRRSDQAITQERLRANATAVLVTGSCVGLLALLALYVIFALPLS